MCAIASLKREHHARDVVVITDPQRVMEYNGQYVMRGIHNVGHGPNVATVPGPHEGVHVRDMNGVSGVPPEEIVVGDDVGQKIIRDHMAAGINIHDDLGRLSAPRRVHDLGNSRARQPTERPDALGRHDDDVYAAALLSSAKSAYIQHTRVWLSIGSIDEENHNGVERGRVYWVGTLMVLWYWPGTLVL